MSKKLKVNKNNEPIYDIRIEKDFDDFKRLFLRLCGDKRKVMVVFDSNTAKYYKASFTELLCGFLSDVFTFEFKAGEESKNLNTVSELYKALIKNNFERKDILIAFGGGVVGDLTGFAAATYLRGIHFIQVPTTLLAMADSSIGGKTGVDFKAYKNMVGAFHQPSLVYMNLSVLHTLHDREYLSGMAEIIKHGYIKDANFVEVLNYSDDKIKSKDYSLTEDILFRSCDIKRGVVESDPTEKGERAVLNFGHSIGHAIEKLMSFGLLHGECVSLGMIAAGAISLNRGLINENELSSMKELLTKYELPIRLFRDEYNFDKSEILEVMKSDKKMEDGRIKFILLESVGKAQIVHDVTDREILFGIDEILD